MSYQIVMPVSWRPDAINGIIEAYEKPPRVLITHRGNGQSLREIDMDSIPRTSGIYQILCVPTGKVYIGSAIDLRHRHNQHFSALRANRHDNTYIQHAWDKHGADAFVFEVIELVSSSLLLEREQYWIDRLHATDRDKGFNQSMKAGSPMAGRKHTPETRQRMKEAHLGREMPPRSDAFRAFLSAFRLGKKVPQSVTDKRMATRRDRYYPATEAQRISRSKFWIVTDPDGNESEIQNLKQFCMDRGLDASNMQKVAYGEIKQHRGWKCRYK